MKNILSSILHKLRKNVIIFTLKVNFLKLSNFWQKNPTYNFQE